MALKFPKTEARGKGRNKRKKEGGRGQKHTFLNATSVFSRWQTPGGAQLPRVVSIQCRAIGRPAKYLDTPSVPALSHPQGPHLKFLGTHHPTSACQQHMEGAWRREQGRRSSGTAGHFVGIVSKAHDCGEGDPQDLAGAACSNRGHGLHLSASLPSPQT